ncbi:hypothetical protein [Flavisericum labens]|uniref:hypothetical protein n=1 Tax=Flavisericum labens TaxID=3377112 RepID=UPI00387B6016
MNEIFKTVRDNLIRSYIFYIPEYLYKDFQQTEFKDLIPIEATNTVVFMNRKGELTANEAQFKRLEISTKCNVFEENVFLLIDAQSKLGESQFQFLMTRYWEHLDIHMNLTCLMSVHLAKYINGVPGNISELFKLQSGAFLKHHTEIKTKFFGFVTGSPFQDRSMHFNQNGKTSNETLKPKNNNIKPKKPQIISNADADAFLLESVFNIGPK